MKGKVIALHTMLQTLSLVVLLLLIAMARVTFVSADNYCPGVGFAENCPTPESSEAPTQPFVDVFDTPTPFATATVAAYPAPVYAPISTATMATYPALMRKNLSGPKH